MSETFSGYEYGNESDKKFHREACHKHQRLMSLKYDFEGIPEKVSSEWHKLENQGPVGSCQGHSLSSCLEGCYWIDTGGKYVQLSRMAAYRFSQQEDGISGDQGSTLSGGVLAAKKGIPAEEHWPYPGKYVTRIPKAAVDNRYEYRLLEAVPIADDNPSAQVCQWIGRGKGFCAIGVKWTSEMDTPSVISNYTGRGRGGGHAVSVLGYDISKKYLYISNSWGTNWGENGVKPITFTAFNRMMRYGWNHGYLYSDLADIDIDREIPDFSIIGDVV